MNNNEYKKYSKHHAKKSKFIKDFLLAYFCGGIICMIGQGFYDLYIYLGLNEKSVKMLVPSTLVFFACLLTGIGIFDKIAKYCGAGTLVPITGFANAMIAPAMDYKTEGLILGVGAKMFTVAGPVIVFGTLSSCIYGILLFIVKAVSIK
ncbi:MAG: stage V sporulation protein AC [Oscillospiraceae bacterium]|nr:stage V sporulation protein AC [Oscillospiraceae bacterium]